MLNEQSKVHNLSSPAVGATPTRIDTKEVHSTPHNSDQTPSADLFILGHSSGGNVKIKDEEDSWQELNNCGQWEPAIKKEHNDTLQQNSNPYNVTNKNNLIMMSGECHVNNVLHYT